MRQAVALRNFPEWKKTARQIYLPKRAAIKRTRKRVDRCAIQF
jgi:hypothetical protein